MSISTDSRKCPKCGGAIVPEAPQGLCPRCLLQQASFPTETRSSAGAVPPDPQDLAAAFPHLEILELIGRGGMGFVFKARQAKLDRLVALKILPQSMAGEPAFAERFAREGRLLARLNHPNIVTVYDFGQANGFFYLLMEFVDGVNLRQAMQAGRFAPDQALAIVPKICEALQFAHNEGILHRDIKPENILLDSRGRVKIADFGIAKLVGEPPAPSTLTGRGGALGTVHYMAPEQVETPAQVDHRADIYSLGVVFYEMLTGELPIGRFAPPSENCDVDPRIDEVVFRALDKKPERRPQSAAEVKTQVESITQTPPSQPEAEPPRPEPSARIHRHETAGGRKVLTLTVGFGLALVVLTAVVWHGLNPAPRKARAQESQLTARSVSGARQDEVAPVPAGGEAVTNEPFTRVFVWARAGAARVGDSETTWSGTIWSDTPLPPGESLLASARLDGQPLIGRSCSTLQFINSQPGKVGNSFALSWFFGGALQKDFGQREVAAAAAQLSAHTNRPIPMVAGKPLELFSVTNAAGRVLTGYAEYTRLVPKPAPGAPTPRAIVQVRRFEAYLPSLQYSVKLPPGYALRTTATMGNVTTQFGTVTPDEYRSSWYIPLNFRNPVNHADYLDMPAQLKAQRALLEHRFRELQDLGPIPVIHGEPFPVFSITNKAGSVYQTWFELLGPSDAGMQLTLPVPTPQSEVPAGPRFLTPQNRTPVMPPPSTRGTGNTGGATQPRINPATGLPLPPGATPALPKIDPLTGLPVDYVPPFPLPAPATNRPKSTPR